MKDLHLLANQFTEIVASGLHYYDKQDSIDMLSVTAKEINNMVDGWKERYKEERLFKAKVDSIVARLMLVEQSTH